MCLQGCTMRISACTSSADCSDTCSNNHSRPAMPRGRSASLAAAAMFSFRWGCDASSAPKPGPSRVMGTKQVADMCPQILMTPRWNAALLWGSCSRSFFLDSACNRCSRIWRQSHCPADQVPGQTASLRVFDLVYQSCSPACGSSGAVPAES